MAQIDYKIPRGEIFRQSCTNRARLAFGSSNVDCSVCVTPGAAPSNSCRILWTPDDEDVYWSSLPHWTGNIALAYPTSEVVGNGVFAGPTPFDYTVADSNLTFDHEQLTSGPMFRDISLSAAVVDNPGPIAWIMEENPCEEGNVIERVFTTDYDLGSTSIAIPPDVNDVHANNAGIRVAYGPTVALKIREVVTVSSALQWRGSSSGAASNHRVAITVTHVSSIVERWSVTARSSGGSFGNPLVCTFSIENLQVGPNNPYSLDTNLSWSDSLELPTFYSTAGGELDRPVTGSGPATVFAGPFNDIAGFYRRTPSGVTLTEGSFNGDSPSSILWRRG